MGKEGEDERQKRERCVHIDALAEKDARDRLSASRVLINPICCRFHRLSAFATRKRNRGAGPASPCSEFAKFLVVFPVSSIPHPSFFRPRLLPPLGSPLIRDSETLGLIKCKMLPANNA